MSFQQMSFVSDTVDSELLEAAALAAGALSLTLTDAAGQPILEPAPGEMPLWPRVRVSLLFAADAQPETIRRVLEAALGAPLPSHTFVEVADRVWEREWLAGFRPMDFGTRLWVCPEGRRVKTPGAVVVRLDPGLAFGTGTHPTTALCLRWLDGAALKGRAVIDYGCGSGILAIAAVKLGARRAWAIDHDPQALRAARENAARNGVSHAVEILPPEVALPEADVLLANILAQPLIELAPRFSGALRPGGELVLSGILADQLATVEAAYRDMFVFRAPTQLEEWLRLNAVRRQPG